MSAPGFDRRSIAIANAVLRSLFFGAGPNIGRPEERIGSERSLILAEVELQGIETLARIDALADRLPTSGTASAADLVDLILWRGLVLVAVYTAAGLLLFLIVRKKQAA